MSANTSAKNLLQRFIIAPTPLSRKCANCDEDISDIIATAESEIKFALKSLDDKFIFNLNGENIIVGRENTMQEYLAEKIFVSRKHCRFSVEGNEIFIEDLNSANSTYVNNKKINVQLTEKAFNVLKENALKNLQNGGRGIGNVVESLFINPLSRFLFDKEISGNSKIFVDDIKISATTAELLCKFDSRKLD